MGHDFNLVLLIGAVAAVHAGGGAESVSNCGSDHVCNIRDGFAATGDARREILPLTYTDGVPMDDNLHSPPRRLIELRIEHGDLDSLIDRLAEEAPLDDLALRRLKKRRLRLRDQIAQLTAQLDPPEPA